MKRLLICLMLALCSNTYAHQSSTSFITLDQNDNVTEGLWKVAIEDLKGMQNFDLNNDGDIQWREFTSSKSELLLLLKSGFKLKEREGMCNINSDNKKLALDTILDRKYILFSFQTNCSLTSITEIRYDYYFNVDNDHKGIITLSDDKKKSNIYVAAVNKPNITIEHNTSSSFIDIVKEGVWHIWMGFDHIIFVLTLLFGVLFVTKNNQCAKNTSNKYQQITEITKVITAFTVAHSITLALAALDIINPSVRFIESAIALTLIIAALHNIRHLLPKRTTVIFSWPIWKMAFVFGLIHGFGFANVLAEMNLSVSNFAETLLAFNLGVEVGQLMIVILFIATSFLLFSFVKLKSLKNVLPVSSVLVMFVGAFWFVERAFNIVMF